MLPCVGEAKYIPIVKGRCHDPRGASWGCAAFLLTGGAFADGPTVYAQFLGGGALGGTIDTVIAHVPQDYELSSGYAVAGTLGVVVANGFSVVLDVMHAHRDYPAFAGYWWNKTSVMGNIKYSLDVNNQVSLYAAAGAGEIFGDDHYDPPDD